MFFNLILFQNFWNSLLEVSYYNNLIFLFLVVIDSLNFQYFNEFLLTIKSLTLIILFYFEELS